MALYIANNLNVKIDAIISDETMPFISGSFSSQIINSIIDRGILKEVKMFISTALSHTNIKNNYSKVVKKIYSKPINKNNISDIIQNLR